MTTALDDHWHPHYRNKDHVGLLVAATAHTGPNLCCFCRITSHQPLNNLKTLVLEPHSLQDEAAFIEKRAVRAMVEGPGLAQLSQWKSWEADGINRLVGGVVLGKQKSQGDQRFPVGTLVSSVASPTHKREAEQRVGQSPPWMTGEQPIANQLPFCIFVQVSGVL